MPAQAGAAVQCQAAYASPLVGLVNGELRCSGPVHWRTAVLTVAAAGPPLTKKEKNRPTSRFTYSYSYSQLYSTTIPTYLLPIYLLSAALSYCSTILYSSYTTVLYSTCCGLYSLVSRKSFKVVCMYICVPFCSMLLYIYVYIYNSTYYCWLFNAT